MFPEKTYANQKQFLNQENVLEGHWRVAVKDT